MMETEGSPRFDWVRKILFGVIALILIVNLISIVRSWAPNYRSVHKGQPAPGFELRLLDGATARLSDFRGRPVVLDFWAHWCAPCRAELPAIDRLHQRYGDRVAFLAIHIDGEPARGAAAAFVRATGLAIPVAFDDGVTAGAYHVATIPMLVVIDSEGRVSEVYRGMARESELAAAIERAK